MAWRVAGCPAPGGVVSILLSLPAREPARKNSPFLLCSAFYGSCSADGSQVCYVWASTQGARRKAGWGSSSVSRAAPAMAAPSSNQAEEETHMADLPPYSTPRWVKIAGIIALVLVLLVGIILVTGVGGAHGPRRHMPSGGGGDPPPSSVIVVVDPPPSGGGPGGHTPPIELRTVERLARRARS